MPAHTWCALVKPGWGCSYPALGEAFPQGFRCWHEAGCLQPHQSAPWGWCELTLLSFAWRNVHGLVLYQRAQHWLSVPGSRFTPEMVLFAQHKAAMKAAPLGSGWVRAIRMEPPGQGGVPARTVANWVAACPQAGQQPSHPLPNPRVFSSLHSCHPLLPPLLWDSPVTSVLPVHTRRGAAWCAGSTRACARWLPARPGVRCTAGTACESPQLPAG